jgi:hypothetical protein
MTNDLNYPEHAKLLIKLLDEDQAELKLVSLAYREKIPKEEYRLINSDYVINSRRRSREALNILDNIKIPSLSNIGKQASAALAVIALHSNLDMMKTVLGAFKAGSDEVLIEVIPALEDKILILSNKKQRFGTQWLEGEDGKPFLYPIEDFDEVNTLREGYGLGLLKYPKILSGENSLEADTKKVSASAQRRPSLKEFKLFKGEDEYE